MKIQGLVPKLLMGGCLLLAASIPTTARAEDRLNPSFTALLAAANGEASQEKTSGEFASVTLRVNRFNAKIFVDKTFYDNSPINAPIMLPPGPHEITVSLPGYDDWTKALNLQPKEEIKFNVNLISSEDRLERAELWSNPWFWGVVGVGVAALAGAGVYYTFQDQFNPPPENPTLVINNNAKRTAELN